LGLLRHGLDHASEAHERHLGSGVAAECPHSEGAGANNMWRRLWEEGDQHSVVNDIFVPECGACEWRAPSRWRLSRCAAIEEAQRVLAVQVGA